MRHPLQQVLGFGIVLCCSVAIAACSRKDSSLASMASPDTAASTSRNTGGASELDSSAQGGTGLNPASNGGSASTSGGGGNENLPAAGGQVPVSNGGDSGSPASSGGEAALANGGGAAAPAGCPPRLQVDPALPCPAPNDIRRPLPPSMDISFNTDAYKGALPSCEPLNPVGGFSFKGRVESLETEQGKVFSKVALYVASVELSPTCGLAVIVGLEGRGLRLSLKEGDVATFSQRIILTAKDNDVLGTFAIHDVDGALLAGRVVGARPGFYDADMLNGLALHVEQMPLCKLLKDFYVMGSLRLEAPDGAGSCAVDSHVAASCCRFWGKDYTVLSQAVLLENYSGPSPLANFDIYRNDFMTLD